MARSARSTRSSGGRRAAVIAGLRTPFVRAGTDFAQLDVLDLARAVTVELLQRTGLDPGQVDHVIYGNVPRPFQYTNLARELVLAAGLPRRTPADTVTLACASACQAITDATNLIERGYADVGGGGDEGRSDGGPQGRDGQAPAAGRREPLPAQRQGGRTAAAQNAREVAGN